MTAWTAYFSETFGYHMSRFTALFKLGRVMLFVLLAVIGIVNLAMATIFIDWIVIVLIAVSVVLVVVIYMMAKVLFRLIFCSSQRKLNKVKAMLENPESLSEEQLLLILDLNQKDLLFLSTSQLFSSSALLRQLGVYKHILVREIGASQLQFDKATEKMSKNVYIDEETEIQTFTDREWYHYLQAKLSFEQILFKRLTKKEKEIVQICKLHGKSVDFESHFGIYKKQVENCSICLSEYESTQGIVVLDCRHYFHQTCLEDWMVEKQSCPLCKTEV
jgi:hypothetical protein